MREQLAADPGVGAVRADEEVGLGAGAVGEVGADPAVGQGLVALEVAAERDDVGEAVEQHLAQRDAADAVVLRDGVVGPRDLDDQQRGELLGAEAERGGLVGDGVAEALPRRRGQAGVQRAAAVRVDVDAVALHPVGAGLRALGDLHLDARPHQPVGEAQAADAAADDENAQGFDHGARIINQTDE